MAPIHACRLYSGYCDVCKKTCDLFDCSTRREAIMTARAYGWRYRKGGVLICGTCVKQEKEERPNA